MRMGVNPLDLANSQVKYYIPDAQIEGNKNDEKFDDNILQLIYKFPTRSRITRARLSSEGQGDQNVKTSIYNKKGLMR